MIVVGTEMGRIMFIVLLLCAVSVQAQETIFYKCTDTKGAVSMQNGTPCAAGMKQEVRKVGEVKTVAAPAAKPKTEQSPAPPPLYGEFVHVGGPRTQRTPAAEAATLPAAPALYQCSTWKGDSYLGETATPEPRCAPLQVVGIDGSANLGMGEACEMKQDSCTEIPADQLCNAWYRRLDDADFKLRYADAQSQRERQAAFDVITTKIKASRCATSVAADKPSAPAPPRKP